MDRSKILSRNEKTALLLTAVSVMDFSKLGLLFLIIRKIKVPHFLLKCLVKRESRKYDSWIPVIPDFKKNLQSYDYSLCLII